VGETLNRQNQINDEAELARFSIKNKIEKWQKSYQQ
jgi:hypothetical protein